MPNTETIIINGHPVVIENIITSGDLLISAIMTALISLMLAVFILNFWGRK